MTDERVAGRFALAEELGRGALGVVWRATDTRTDREVALKRVLVPSDLPDAVIAEGLPRIAREQRLLAELDHPNAVRVHDVLEEDDGLYIVMELVEGVSLKELVGEEGPLPLDRAARIGLQLLDVLTAAHGAGVVHCEVKPANVLVAPGDVVKLGDFGVSALQGAARLTGTGAFLGPPAYLSPEQARGGPCTRESDLWALGATVYHMLEGRDAFEGRSFSAVLAKVLDGLPARPLNAGPLTPLLAGLLRREPSSRPRPAQIRRALTEAAESPPSETPVIIPPEAWNPDPPVPSVEEPPDGPVTAVPGGPPPFTAPVRRHGLIVETAARVGWTLLLSVGALAVAASSFGSLTSLGLTPFLLLIGGTALGRSAYLVAGGVTGLQARNVLEVGPRGIAFRRGAYSAGYSWEDVETVTVTRQGLRRRPVLLLLPAEGDAERTPLLPLRLTGSQGRSPWLHHTGGVALCRFDELEESEEAVVRQIGAFAGERWRPPAGQTRGRGRTGGRP